MEEKKVKIFSNTLPRKHGAWSIFILSLLSGTLCSGNFQTLPFFLLLLSSLSGFLLRENIGLFLKLRKKDERRHYLLKLSTFYFVIIFITFLTLIIFYKFYLLIPIAFAAFVITLISFYFTLTRRELTVISEILGISGLSLLFPSFYYISKGVLDKGGIYLSLLVFLFFTSSVFHVRYLVRERNVLSKGFFGRLKSGKYSIAYHTFLFLFALFCSFKGYLPFFAFVSVLPVFIKSWYFALKKFSAPIPIRKIGFIEVFTSAGFTIILIISCLL